MMLWVHCAFLVLCSSVGCEQEEVTEIHGDITGPGPKGNMFEEVFKFAFKNFYKNNPSTPASSVESHRRYNKNYARRHHYYHPPPPQPPPIQPAVQPIAPQYIFPQHYYMPPPAPPIPPYPAYHYPPYYPPHPPPPPPHYVYPYPPLKEKSAEKTTQNLWELYQQLKVKFETTNPDQNTPPAENYRHYNRRVQNINGYPPRENRRYYQQNFQTVQQQYQQPEVEKVSVAPEEPFARYSAAVQSRQKIERPAQYVPVETKAPVETRPTVAATKEIPTPAPETPKPATIARVVGKEQIFEPRQEEDDAVKIAKVKHWENIISNIKSSLGITDEPDPEMTVPDFVKRDHSEIAAIMFTESPEDPEAKKYGITLIHNSQPDSIDDAHIGFDWKNEEKLARKPTRDMLQLYKEYKEKYEFPDYLSEKRRLERAEYKYKKKLLYKSRGMTYDDGNPDDGATFGDDTLLNLGRDPNYYPGVLRTFLKKK